MEGRGKRILLLLALCFGLRAETTVIRIDLPNPPDQAYQPPLRNYTVSPGEILAFVLKLPDPPAQPIAGFNLRLSGRGVRFEAGASLLRNVAPNYPEDWLDRQSVSLDAITNPILQVPLCGVWSKTWPADSSFYYVLAFSANLAPSNFSFSVTEWVWDGLTELKPEGAEILVHNATMNQNQSHHAYFIRNVKPLVDATIANSPLPNPFGFSLAPPWCLLLPGTLPRTQQVGTLFLTVQRLSLAGDQPYQLVLRQLEGSDAIPLPAPAQPNHALATAFVYPGFPNPLQPCDMFVVCRDTTTAFLRASIGSLGRPVSFPTQPNPT